MSDPVIRAVSLGKVYRVWHHPSDMLKEAVSGRRRHSEFEALRDISFEVPKGSVVGIMGRNGAGKSTLLRIIAGTLDATSGRVSVAGRISAILELGTGFHLDYSGRENVFLGGLCLGLTRTEIAARLDEIVGFAELEEFIDQPFRTYSSGMQARLTFAVATAVDPDVLIIDEALAVGDARFRLKSFDRVRRFRQQGKSILLVSHSIDQIVSICDHAILLERGGILAEGEPGKVGNIYHELLFAPRATGRAPSPAAHDRRANNGDLQATTIADSSEPLSAPTTAEGDVHADLSSQLKDSLLATGMLGVPADGSSAPTIWAAPLRDADPKYPPKALSGKTDPFGLNGTVPETNGREHRYGDRAVRIVDFFIRDSGLHRVSALKSLQRYEFMIFLEAKIDVTRLCVEVLVRTPRGIEIFGAHSPLPPEHPAQDMARGTTLRVRVPLVANLGHGTYFASAVVANSDGVKHDVRFDALEFSVNQTGHHDLSLTNLDPRFIYERPTETNNYLEQQSWTKTP